MDFISCKRSRSSISCRLLRLTSFWVAVVRGFPFAGVAGRRLRPRGRVPGHGASSQRPVWGVLLAGLRRGGRIFEARSWPRFLLLSTKARACQRSQLSGLWIPLRRRPSLQLRLKIYKSVHMPGSPTNCRQWHGSVFLHQRTTNVSEDI